MMPAEHQRQSLKLLPGDSSEIALWFGFIVGDGSVAINDSSPGALPGGTARSDFSKKNE